MIARCRLARVVSIARALLVVVAASFAHPFGTRSAAAQTQYGMLVLELPASARALAMGDAFLLGSTDADALHSAPAFGGSLRGFSAGLGWWDEDAVLLALAAGGEWWGGALGGALRSLEYESATPGYVDPLTAEPVLGAEGPVRISERVASLAYAHRLWLLDASVTAKLLAVRAAGEAAHGVAFDVAIGRAFGPVRVALAGRHLGRALDVGVAQLTLPARASLSVATSRSVPIGPLDLAAAATLGLREDGSVLPAGGVELGYWPIPGRTFFARGGLRRVDTGVPFTFGAGFSGDQLSIDWAFAPYDEAPTDGAHYVTVRLR